MLCGVRQRRALQLPLEVGLLKIRVARQPSGQAGEWLDADAPLLQMEGEALLGVGVAAVDARLPAKGG